MQYAYSVKVIYPVTSIQLLVRANDAQEALEKAKYNRRGASQFVEPLSWEVRRNGNLLLKETAEFEKASRR